MDKLKSIYAAVVSARIAIVLVVVLTIWAELSADFKTWLTDLTGHHWVTKSWATILVFALLFCLFRFTGPQIEPDRLKKTTGWLITLAIAGFLIILGFYIYEFLI